jgi:hypothetical protein
VEFPFSDFQTYKRRPGLVLASGEMDLLVARLTTHPPREPSDVVMKHWSEIGLLRASTIRLAKLATIDVNRAAISPLQALESLQKHIRLDASRAVEWMSSVREARR